MEIVYRPLAAEEIDRELFAHFIRKQVVTDCRRKADGAWIIVNAPFIDDWNESDYEFLVRCLKKTAETGGAVIGAFENGNLKGFASVESAPVPEMEKYRDLTSLHVSADRRGSGIGRALFDAAKAAAKKFGGEKLYISAHSAVETQAFYAAMGCRDAETVNAEHVKKEPFDCQLECDL